MKRKNKGFTMIELIAVITIMGILAIIAIPAVTKYVTKGRKTSIDSMLKSSYEAAENYMMDNNIIFKTGSQTIQVSTLVNEQYLEMLYDPAGKNNERCETSSGSVVKVTAVGTTEGGLPNYKYEVTLKCPLSGEKKETFPK